MKAGSWVLLGVVGAVILAGIVGLLVVARQQGLLGIRWERCGPWTCRGQAEALPLVEARAEASLRCLGATPEEGADLRRTGRVVVWDMDVTSWQGRTVAGLTDWPPGGQPTVYVGRSLAALPHELAHVLELRRTGDTDLEHTSPAWTGPGGWYQLLEGCP